MFLRWTNSKIIYFLYLVKISYTLTSGTLEYHGMQIILTGQATWCQTEVQKTDYHILKQYQSYRLISSIYVGFLFKNGQIK